MPEQTFSHQALLYRGRDDLIARATPFVQAGLEAGEPVMVAMTADKLEALRGALGRRGDRVHFVDMAGVGRNPACIIPAWREFLEEHRRPGTGARGIGEPIWSGRSSAELVECQLHEALLNVAFADTERFELLCPYDVDSLDAAVVHEARCSHPVLRDEEGLQPSREYRGLDAIAEPFETPLPPPARRPEVISFEAATLAEVRSLVLHRAEEAGMGEPARRDLALAVHELATNSVRHGGGNGILRLWRAGDLMVCEVKDRGWIRDPLVGRHTVAADELHGRGLWIVNRLCDLVRIRSARAGTVVRVCMAVHR